MWTRDGPAPARHPRARAAPARPLLLWAAPARCASPRLIRFRAPLRALSPPRAILPVVALSQLLILSLWFSGTAVAPDLRVAWSLSEAEAAALTWAVQVGFVAGTLVLAGLNVADRVPPPRLILVAALAGAGANVLLVIWSGHPLGAVGLRFLTGAALAGVYPVAMKLLASWYARPGLSLGVMVGALTLGSGTPHLVRAFGPPWQAVVLVSSVLAVLGGVLVARFTSPGPLLPARSPFDPRAFLRAFRIPDFRRSALGYFGHMWELYAFWGLLPLFLAARGLAPAQAAALTFAAFLAGAAGSAWGGFLSRRVGEARVACGALVLSGLACLLSPWAFVAPLWLLVPFLLAWGAAVIADSAQFSALSARASPRAYVGTALTMQNAVGFAVTFVSVALLPPLAAWAGWRWAFLALAPGALLGAWAVAPLARRAPG